MEKAKPEFVGVDVSKEKLDVHFHFSGRTLVVSNDDDGTSILAIVLALRNVRQVVLESTGCYGRRLLAALDAVEVPVACVPPQRVRKFAEAVGVKAKTDGIDAKVIAHYAATVDFPERVKPAPAAQRLEGLLRRRAQLVEMQTAEGNRREFLPAELLDDAEELLNVLRKNVAALGHAMKRLVDDDDDLSKRAEAMQTISGVGLVLTSTFLAKMPELGRCTGKQAAALVGVAPFNDDSGGRKGKRSIRGGRRQVRDVLYMGTRAAVRFEPVLMEFYARLRAAGKSDKVAITAAMRKLVVIVNARVRDALAPLPPAVGG